MKPKSKVAVVTGSSKGIGAGISKVLAQAGYDVITTYFKEKEKGEKTVKDIVHKGGNAELMHLDVTSEENVKDLFEIINKKYEKLDVLVNNAAVDHYTPFEELSFDVWKEITQLKIDGNFLCTKYATPLLKKSDNGNIIMSSTPFLRQ